MLGFVFSSPPYRRSYSLDLAESGAMLLFGGCADDKLAVRKFFFFSFFSHF